MKKCVILGLMALLLCGCAAEETFETIADELVLTVMAEPAEVTVELPGEVVVPTLEGDGGRIYLGQDYEIMLQTLSGGDLDATIRSVTGYHKDDLTVMETERDGVKRYEFVWASAGETGDMIGRGVVLDDGSYHYVLSVLRQADATEDSQIVWDQVFTSFSLA